MVLFVNWLSVWIKLWAKLIGDESLLSFLKFQYKRKMLQPELEWRQQCWSSSESWSALNSGKMQISFQPNFPKSMNIISKAEPSTENYTSRPIMRLTIMEIILEQKYEKRSSRRSSIPRWWNCSKKRVSAKRGKLCEEWRSARASHNTLGLIVHYSTHTLIINDDNNDDENNNNNDDNNNNNNNYNNNNNP